MDGVVLNSVFIIAVLTGAGGVIAFLFRLLITAKEKEAALLLAEKDRTLKELESIKKSYAEIAAEALKSATETANYYRAKEGKPPIIPIAPVVTESHSPSTAAQRETAQVATMRAAMAQVKVATGQAPRTEPEHATEASDESLPPVSASPSLIEAMAIKDAIAKVPEKTADKVVEKIKENEEKS